MYLKTIFFAMLVIESLSSKITQMMLQKVLNMLIPQKFCTLPFFKINLGIFLTPD